MVVRRFSRPPVRVAVLAALMLFLMVLSAGASAISSEPTGPDRAASVAPPLATASPSWPPVDSHPDTAGFLASVANTLVLYNRTTFSGYEPSLSTSFPQISALDPENGTDWIAGGNVGTTGIDVMNVSNDAGVRILPGGMGSQIAYDATNNTMWVTGADTSDTVTVYNASTYAVVANITTGLTPTALVYDSSVNAVFVVNFGSANVTEIDATSYAVLAFIGVGGEPESIVLDSNTGYLYVPTGSGYNITVFPETDPTSAHSLIGLTGTGTPGISLFDASNNELYVSGMSPGVQIYDTSTDELAGTISLAPGETYAFDGLALDPTNDSLFVAQFFQNNVTEYSPAPTSGSVNSPVAVTTLSKGSNPDSMVFDAAMGRVLVVEQDQDHGPSVNLTEISAATNGIAAWGPLYDLPYGVATNSAGNIAFVYDGQSGDLDWVNAETDQVTHSLFVGYNTLSPRWVGGSVVYDPDNNTVFVDFDPYNVSQADVAVVDALNYTVSYFPTTDFSYPAGMAFDTLDDLLFVDNFGNNNVTVLQPGVPGVVEWVDVGSNPIGAVFDSGDNTIFVSNEDSDTLSVIGGSPPDLSVVKTIDDVGDEPLGLAYDPVNQTIFVGDSDEGDVAVFNATTYAAFGPIPTGYLGYPTFLTYDATNETIIFTEPTEIPLVPGGELGFINATNRTYYGYLQFGDSLGPLAWDGVTGDLFVSGTYPGAVYQLSTGAVTKPPPPLVVYLNAEPSTVENGSTTEFETTVENPVSTLTYNYTGLPPGCVTVNEKDLPCTPNRTGTYTVWVFVNQTGGGSGKASATLTVTARTGPLGVTLEAEPSALPVNNTTTITATVSGGVAPFTFTYSTLPSGCTSENSSTLDCEPTEAGSFVIGVNVSDNVDSMANATARLFVGSLAAVLGASPDSIDLGNTTTLSATVSGNPNGSLTYVYSDLPAGCVSDDTAHLSCTPSAAGRFSPKVEVNDSIGDVAAATAELTVTKVFPPLTTGLTAEPTPILLGRSTTLTATPSGGQAPLTYAYLDLPAGCTSANASTLACTPTQVGVYTIEVNVTDPVGQHAIGSATLSVEAHLTATLVASPTSIGLGNSSTLTTSVAGYFTGALTYRYTALPPGCSSADSSTLVCTPTAKGSYTPQIEVNDSFGNFANASATLGVTANSSSSGSTTSSSSPFPWTWVAAGIVALALVLIVLIASRRRRDNKKEPPKPASEWKPPEGGSSTPPPGSGPPPGGPAS